MKISKDEFMEISQEKHAECKEKFAVFLKEIEIKNTIDAYTLHTFLVSATARTFVSIAKEVDEQIDDLNIKTVSMTLELMLRVYAVQKGIYKPD